MGKIIDKIREFIFGEKFVSEKIEDVFKAKKLSDTQKFKNFLDVFGDYYLNKHKQRMQYETAETYYEQYMKNGKKNQEVYEKCYNIIEDSANYNNCLSLQSFTKMLKNVDIEKLSNAEKFIYEQIMDIANKYLPNDIKYVSVYSIKDADRTKVYDEIKNTNANIITLITENYEKTHASIATEKELEQCK